MNYHRFTLEHYRGVGTRHICPSCERPRCFARYIDTEGKIEFPDNVGRCDHEQRCGYHFTPKAYFAEHPTTKEELHSTSEVIHKPVVPAPPSFIDREMMEKTLKGYELNNLYLFLCGRLGKENALQLMRHYHSATPRNRDTIQDKRTNRSSGGHPCEEIVCTSPPESIEIRK